MADLAALLALASPMLISTISLAQDGPPRGDREGRRQVGERGGPGGEGRGGRGGDFGGGPGGRGGLFGRGLGGIVSVQGMYEPDYIRRDLPFIAQALSLDKDQGTIAEAILAEYEVSFTEASEAARAAMQALRPGQSSDPAVQQERDALREEMRAIGREFGEAMRGRGEGRRRRGGEDGAAGDRGANPEISAELEKVRDRMTAIRARLEEIQPPPPTAEELERMQSEYGAQIEAWLTERERLRQEFAANMVAILTEPQAALFSIADRDVRREKLLPRGDSGEERVDLNLLVREFEFAPEAAEFVDPVIVAWKDEVDAAMTARDEQIRQTMRERLAVLSRREFSALEPILAQESALRTNVRMVNKAGMERVAAVLTDIERTEEAERVRDAFNRRAFEAIFRPTVSQRSFAAAREFDDLIPEVRGALEELALAYETELAVKNGVMMDLTRQSDATEYKRRVERMEQFAAQFGSGGGGQNGRGGFGGGPGGPGGFGQGDEALNQIRDDRREHDRQFRSQIESLLTPEQIARLPEARFGGGRGGQGGNSEQAQQRRQEFLDRFDTNKDGELSDEERQAARESMRRQRENEGGGE